jgi:hypothetical protein
MKLKLAVHVHANMPRLKTLIDLTAGLIGITFDELFGMSENGEAGEVGSDDLTELNGVGPAYARRLNEAGITRYGQVAEMSPEQLREKMHLSEWQGDPENWIEQAKEMS